MPLSDTAVRNARPADKAYTMPDTLGLSLYVSTGGVKSWHFRFTWLGKQARISLGTYPEISLKDARQRRDEYRAAVAKGEDPRELRREQKAATHANGMTFRHTYGEWLKFRAGALAEGTIKGIRIAMENDVLPAIGARQITSIKRSDVIAIVRRIEGRGAITSAVKTRQWMAQVFRYAIAIGALEDNPCAEMHAVTEKIDAYRPRPFAEFAEMPAIMSAIQACAAGETAKAAVLLMIYTACRPGEVRFAEWREVDLESATWTIPAERMKMRRDHVVPLPSQAVALLEKMLPISGRFSYVFTGRSDYSRPIGTNYATSVMDMCGLKGRQSPHGFRHMFSTEMNHRGYNSDWIERQLAHADDSVIRDTYNHATYLDQRRGMMQDWADSLDPAADSQPVLALYEKS